MAKLYFPLADFKDLAGNRNKIAGQQPPSIGSVLFYHRHASVLVSKIRHRQTKRAEELQGCFIVFGRLVAHIHVPHDVNVPREHASPECLQ